MKLIHCFVQINSCIKGLGKVFQYLQTRDNIWLRKMSNDKLMILGYVSAVYWFNDNRFNHAHHPWRLNILKGPVQRQSRRSRLKVWVARPPGPPGEKQRRDDESMTMKFSIHIDSIVYLKMLLTEPRQPIVPNRGTLSLPLLGSVHVRQPAIYETKPDN